MYRCFRRAVGVRPGVQVWTEGDKEYLGAQLGAGQPWVHTLARGMVGGCQLLCSALWGVGTFVEELTHQL